VALPEIIGNFGFGEMLPAFGFAEMLPALLRVEHRALAVQRSHRAVAGNVLHCYLQARCATLFALFCQRLFDYASEPFLRMSADRLWNRLCPAAGSTLGAYRLNFSECRAVTTKSFLGSRPMASRQRRS